MGEGGCEQARFQPSNCMPRVFPLPTGPMITFTRAWLRM